MEMDKKEFVEFLYLFAGHTAAVQAFLYGDLKEEAQKWLTMMHTDLRTRIAYYEGDNDE